MSNNIFLTNNFFSNTNEIQDEKNELFEAAIKGDEKKFLELISSNFNINIRDSKGRNALFWAIHYKNYFMVKLLLKQGIEKEVSPCLSAINYAVYKNDVKLIKLLKSCGLDINEYDQVASTPLIYAVLYNKLHSIDYLMNNGASLTYEDSLGNSALSLAFDLRIEYLINKFKKHLEKESK